MRVAETLSDLTSLYLAVQPSQPITHKFLLTSRQDPKAALALVTARVTDGGTAQTETMSRHEDHDPDLHRAKDLVQLHAEVKVAHQDGTEKELNEARAAVAKVLREV